LSKKKLADEVLVYKCDELDDETPVYAIAEDVKEIPEDADGESVGVYVLRATYKFKVKRELI
jgi:hypothetical protein